MRRSILAAVLLGLAACAVHSTFTASEAVAQDDRFERIIADALRAYNEGRYEAALDLYFEAKVLQDLAEIDYSIARTYHNLNQCDQAEKFYKRVQNRLSELPDGYEARVEKYLIELPTTCVSAKPEEVKVVEPVQPVPPTNPVEPARPVDSGSAGPDWVSIGIMGGGAALLLGGLIVDVAGAGLVDEHKDLVTNPDSGTEEARRKRIAELEDEMDTQKIVAYTLYGIGGAALLTGTVLLIVNMASDDASGSAAADWQLHPALGPDGAGMTLRATW